MNLLTEAKDIRSELEMISFVLEEQTRLLPLLKDAVKDEVDILKGKNQKVELRTTFDTQVHEINGILERLERMNREVGEFYDSVSALTVNILPGIDTVSSAINCWT